MTNLTLTLLLTAALWFAGAANSRSQSATTPNDQEAKLIAVLQSQASQKEKADACRELAHLGTKNAVPALAALLGNDALSHMARYGLETIPDPSVDTALRQALGQVKGRLLAGVIGSIGVRHDMKAIDLLAKFLPDSDAEVADAAARALGEIGTPDAAKVMRNALPKTPANRQLAVCEGLFRCAEALTAKNDRKLALAIYDELRAIPAAHQIRAGAWRGAILLQGKKGLPLLTQALLSDDFVLVDAAARAALEMKGPEVTPILTANFDKLSLDKQILVLLVLGKRADAAALPAVFKAAKTGDKMVRLVAIRILPEIGSGSAIPFLAEFLKDPDSQIAQTAQDALAGFPGSSADTAVAAMLVSKDNQEKLLGVDLVGKRRLQKCVPELFKAANDTNPSIRIAAVKVLGDLAAASDLPALLGLLVKSAASRDTDAAQQAVIAVCRRSGNPDASATQVIADLSQAQPAAKSALLRVLSAIGGAKALKAVRTAVDDSNPDVHGAALRALGSWQTADAAPELLALAQKAANPSDKLLCLRSYLALLDNPEMPSEQRLAMCRQATGLVQSTDEKRLLLAALGGIYSPATAPLILPYLEDKAVKSDAAAAAVNISGMLLQQKDAAKFAAQLIPLLEKAVQSSENTEASKRAQSLLGQARAKQ